jgi:hypothetical protein
MLVVDGTYYDAKTPTAVVRALEHARKNGYRIRLAYGDRKTGKDWHERYEVVGYVHRSMGPQKIPILVYNKRAWGGSGIMTDNIVKISFANKKDGGLIWKHSRYHR